MSDETLAAGAAAAENPAETVIADSGKVETPALVSSDKPIEAAAGPETKEPEGKSAKAAETKPVREDQSKPQGPWGDDWREKLAGKDEKRLERLKRLASPEALLQAHEEAQRKISEGLKPKGRPGEKATDEEWAEYRKEHGIPDKVEDFVKAIVLPDKREIGEIDKPVIEAFAERAMKKGIPPADMAEMVDEYYKMQEEVQFQQAEEDAKFRKEAEKELKETYGGDYAGNLAALRPYFEGADGELFDALMGGRTADGRKIGNDPRIMKFLVSKAVAENPLATVLPTGNNSIATVNNEIAALEKRMGEDRIAWHKDTAAQERYRQLITARDKIKA